MRLPLRIVRRSSVVLLALSLLVGCAPAAPPAPTAAPAKPAEPAKAAPAAAPAPAPAASPATAPAAKAEASPAAAPAAAAKPAAKEDRFYEGKTITFIVGFTPGGGFDLQARMLAKVLPKYIPGNPRIQVENKPGAGSLAAANELYNTSPKDGTVIAMFTETVIFSAIIGSDGVQLDPAKVSWLGSPEVNANACVARGDAGFKSIQDLVGSSRPLSMGSTATTSSNWLYPTLLNHVAGTNFKIVTGFPGIAEVLLAMEKGEVQGMCTGWVDTIRRFPDKFQSGEMVPLIQNALNQHPDLPNIPLADTIVKTPEGKQMLMALNAPNAVSKPIAAPPGIPAERLAILRAAFEQAFKDPEWLAEAKAQPNFDISPKTGSEVEKIVADVSQIPPDIRQKLKEVLSP